jgi:hypothetical protein
MTVVDVLAFEDEAGGNRIDHARSFEALGDLDDDVGRLPAIAQVGVSAVRDIAALANQRVPVLLHQVPIGVRIAFPQAGHGAQRTV